MESANISTDDEIVFQNIGSKSKLRVKIPQPMKTEKPKRTKSKSTSQASYAVLNNAMEIGCAFVATSEPNNYDEALKPEERNSAFRGYPTWICE